MANDNSREAIEEIERDSTSKLGERPECFKNTLQEVLFVLTTTMAIAMGSFVTGSVTVVSSFIGKDLNMTTAEITWITSASSLAGGAFLLFFGRVADLFGRKTLFLGSLFLFAVFCLAAGFSKNPITLDVLNGVIGFTTASAVPPAQGMLGVIYEKPSKRKNYAFACFSAGNPLGFVFGTIFSGIATQLFNWRASFFLLAIIYLAFTIVAIFTVPMDTTEKQRLNWDALYRFDVLGTVLTVGGIGMFSAALSLGPTAPDGWKTSYVLAFLILGIFLMIAFVFWENYFEYPLVPMSIWRDRDFSLVIVILLLGFMSFPVSAFFAALYFQQVWQFSALETALHLLPMAIMGILVNIFAGLMLHRISNQLLMYIGSAAYTVSFMLMAVNRRSDSYWAFFFPALILDVVGADLEFNVANMYVLSSLPPDQQSIAGGLFQTVTKLCMTLGYGIATALFNGVSKNPPRTGYYRGDPSWPYATVFWYSAVCCALSVALVPWLRIRTQGHGADTDGKDRPEVVTVNRAAGEEKNG
ncbi:MAG: hypothetical protein M1821_002612 [Bathelium mastoideum]|nr:MAG: hypothetical protein M1821_002612 [Bathelium mastoideum]KAI9685525.1 MAG: hypothetical protein M1822_004383 [Bathelium mastoideum]